jgi:hypothetical protein
LLEFEQWLALALEYERRRMREEAADSDPQSFTIDCAMRDGEKEA